MRGTSAPEGGDRLADTGLREAAGLTVRAAESAAVAEADDWAWGSLEKEAVTVRGSSTPARPGPPRGASRVTPHQA